MKTIAIMIEKGGAGKTTTAAAVGHIMAKNHRVLLIDDLIATGGSAEAAVKLIRRCGGNVVECAFIIELPDLKGKDRLSAIDCPVYTLCQFEGD